MSEVLIENNTLKVRMKGIRKLWTLKSELSFPVAHVSGVTVDTEILRKDAPNTLQKRLGTNLIRIYFGGIFKQDGDLVFWDVKHNEAAVVIALDNEKFSRLVVGVDDAHATAEMIENSIEYKK